MFRHLKDSCQSMWVGQLSRYSDGLDGPEIESRWGARFSAPVQTGPEAHPDSFKMGTGFFPGVKSGRGETLIPRPFYCRGHGRVEL